MTRFVSDMKWVSQVNGWGPAERDQSNGELGSGDGQTLTIGGVTYVKGLGVHANSEIRVQLGGACTTFNAVVGLDDEVVHTAVCLRSRDGTPLYSSGVLTGSSPGVPVSIAVGFSQLALIVLGPERPSITRTGRMRRDVRRLAEPVRASRRACRR